METKCVYLYQYKTYVAMRFDALRAAALEFLARALYAPSILPRACVGVTP